jgi:hypothetical protein
VKGKYFASECKNGIPSEQQGNNNARIRGIFRSIFMKKSASKDRKNKKLVR